MTTLTVVITSFLHVFTFCFTNQSVNSLGPEIMVHLSYCLHRLRTVTFYNRAWGEGLLRVSLIDQLKSQAWWESAISKLDSNRSQVSLDANSCHCHRLWSAHSSLYKLSH